MRLIAKAVRISRAKFHCNRLKLYKLFKIGGKKFRIGLCFD